MATTSTTTRHRQPRFPLDPVLCRNLCDLSRRTGYPLRTIQRWKTSGIPRYSADELAVRLGVHPANIWPQWIETV
jgi:hypothetical protein